MMCLSSAEVLDSGREALGSRIAELFEALFPLWQLAEGLATEPVVPVVEHYTFAQLEAETNLPTATLERWLASLERKGQAILYGPPGTGKTYVAERLARYLAGSNVDLVQFHPAYSYEDFIQGIRPQAGANGLDYPVVQGRFLEFCQRAGGIDGPCVLIIDEINRANLARVFGELMYLLEYRDQEVPLAGGGRFKIPANVRLLGTMNTADRSIALVDHALRRRFAFLRLEPQFEVLRRFHATTNFGVEPLVNLLQDVNRAIDDEHYSVGISFFLREALESELPEIWSTEIEPYLEEFFFDRPQVARQFRWESISSRLA